MSDLTPEQLEDIKSRKASFIEEYDALCKKHQMEQVSGPMLTPVAQNLFAITMISDVRDTKYLPVESPIKPSMV